MNGYLTLIFLLIEVIVLLIIPVIAKRFEPKMTAETPLNSDKSNFELYEFIDKMEHNTVLDWLNFTTVFYPLKYNMLERRHERVENLYDKYMMSRTLVVLTCFAGAMSLPLFGLSVFATLPIIPTMVCVHRMYKKTLFVLNDQREKFAAKMMLCAGVIESVKLELRTTDNQDSTKILLKQIIEYNMNLVNDPMIVNNEMEKYLSNYINLYWKYLYAIGIIWISIIIFSQFLDSIVVEFVDGIWLLVV